MNRRELFKSVGAASLLGTLPFSSAVASGATRTIILPPATQGMAFTIQNLGVVPLIVRAPGQETISLDTEEIFLTR